jgi:SAM-dependent methyltransferase
LAKRSPVELDPSLRQAYDAPYSDGTLQRWRELGAQAKAARLLAVLNRRKLRPQRVLEVGAGDGSVSAALATGLSAQGLSPEMHALEISSSGVEAIKARQMPGLARVERFDGYQLPYADASIDLVVLSHVLEHVEHERVLLRELHRVARWVLIEVPRELQAGADRRVEHFLSYGHINLYSPTALRFLLATEGLSVIEQLLAISEPKLLKMSYGGRMSPARSLEYGVRSLLIRLPIRAVRERFCNTITVLCRPSKRPALLNAREAD